MKNTILLFALLFSLGCSQSEFQSLELASQDADQAENEPAGLPDDIPDSVNSMHIEEPVAFGDLAVSSETIQLANGKGQIWDGCDTRAVVRGGYNSDAKCGKGYFHPAFVQHLNNNLFSCIERAAASANIPQPSKVFINHLGTYVDRNGRGSSTLSMHAYAKAIDIAKFNLYDSGGKLTQIRNQMSEYRGANALFYNSFRACWKESLPRKCQPGQREFNGSIGHPKSALGGNNLHTGHIHLSFPPCAG